MSTTDDSGYQLPMQPRWGMWALGVIITAFAGLIAMMGARMFAAADRTLDAMRAEAPHHAQQPEPPRPAPPDPSFQPPGIGRDGGRDGGGLGGSRGAGGGSAGGDGPL